MRRCTFAAAALALLAPLAAGDVEGELARLRSPSAAERAAAERWLAAHLEPDDLAAVAETALAGEFEVRARLTNAIGSDERHFDLAVLLACEPEPALRRLGASAIDAMAARWFGSSTLPPIGAAKLEERLAGLFAQPFALRWAAGALAEDFERLARARPAIDGGSERKDSIGIALDPLLAVESGLRRDAAPVPGGAAKEAWLEGVFDALLFDLARAHGVELEAFGFGGPHPWIRVVHPADSGRPDAGGQNGVELVVRWCREVIEFGDRPRGEAAARAVAGTAWTGAIAWLERRWRRFGDRAALAGVLLAASRGQVAPGLAGAKSVEALLAEADAALAAGGPVELRFAGDVAAALARVPPVSADAHDDPATVVLRGFEQASPAGRRLRAVIVAGMRRAPEPWRAARAADLARTPSVLDAQTSLAYLRALAETERGEPAQFELAPAAPLLELAERLRGGAELVTWARAAGARPPGAWRDPRGVPREASDATRLTALDWWIAFDPQAGAEHIVQWIESSRPLAPLGDRLADRVARGDGARVERAFEIARERASEALASGLDRAEAFAGTLSIERARELEARSTAAAPVAGADLPLLGALAGRLATEDAVKRLVDALAPWIDAAKKAPATTAAPWADAASRAYRGLRAAGPQADREAERLLEALKASMRGATHEVKRRLHDGSWPPPPAGPVRSLAVADPGA
jgi:hypothetical protein